MVNKQGVPVIYCITSKIDVVLDVPITETVTFTRKNSCPAMVGYSIEVITIKCKIRDYRSCLPLCSFQHKEYRLPDKYNVTKLCAVAASSLEFLMSVGVWLCVKLGWLLCITLQELTSIVYILGPPENFQKSDKPRPIYSTGCDSSEFVYIRTRSGQ